MSAPKTDLAASGDEVLYGYREVGGILQSADVADWKIYFTAPGVVPKECYGTHLFSGSKARSAPAVIFAYYKSPGRFGSIQWGKRTAGEYKYKINSNKRQGL